MENISIRIFLFMLTMLVIAGVYLDRYWFFRKTTRLSGLLIEQPIVVFINVLIRIFITFSQAERKTYV